MVINVWSLKKYAYKMRNMRKSAHKPSVCASTCRIRTDYLHYKPNRVKCNEAQQLGQDCCHSCLALSCTPHLAERAQDKGREGIRQDRMCNEY